MSAHVTIGNRAVGGDAPPFVVAEIGANHDGDVAVAHQSIDAFADTGVDAVKFQTYCAEELVADGDRVLRWGPPGAEREEPIGAMFDRIALPRSAHAELFDHARERGILAFSTPFSIDGVAFLADLDVPAIKLASSDLGYLQLIEAAAKTGIPTILSTGKSTLGEIDAAVSAFRNAGGTDLVVLHCVAVYPAPIEEMNLRTIPALAAMFPDVVMGLSDHTLDNTAAIASVALGAAMIEKHATISRDRVGPDHWMSNEPPVFAELVRALHDAHVALGTANKHVTVSEVAERTVSTRSIVIAHPVPAGHRLCADDLKVVRPGTGIHPHRLDDVVGRSVRHALGANHVLQWEDLA